ncbi:MAG: hypothetical protein WBD09_07970 [Halobacteriota archaeon]
MIEGISLLWLWAILVGAIIATFRIMEDTATPDAKRKVAVWIKSFAAKSISQTVVESPRWFIEAFDRIFGDRHLTRRCFLRSCGASILAVFVMTVVWAVLDPTSCQRFTAEVEHPILFILLILLIALFLNLVPDYISLLETRWILRKVAQAGIKKLIVLLVLDVIITGGIFVCGLVITGILIGCSEGDPIEVVVEFVDEFSEILNALILFTTVDEPPFGIFFYSTYFTSVWFYLFVASSIATKLLYSLGRIGNRVLVLLKVEEKPFQSMGLIVVGLLTLAFAISAIIGAIG